MEVKTAVKNDGGSENQKAYMDRMQESGMATFENQSHKCSIRRSDRKPCDLPAIGAIGHEDGKLLKGFDKQEQHEVKEFTSSKTGVSKVIGMTLPTFRSYLETNKCSKEHKTFVVDSRNAKRRNPKKCSKWMDWKVKLG